MSALALRILACVCMLLDHIGFCVPALHWLRLPGRLAFPLFVFLLVNGYEHTRSRLRYAIRLAVLALVSQLPFSLLFYDGALTAMGNVGVTLTVTLLCLWYVDRMQRGRGTRWLAPLLPAVLTLLWQLRILRSDYGAAGLLLVLSIRRFRHQPLLLTACCLLSLYASELLQWLWQGICALRGMPQQLVWLSDWRQTEVLALLAIPLMRCSNGKPGWQPRGTVAKRLFQLAFYAFYPAHMLVLWLLCRG